MTTITLHEAPRWTGVARQQLRAVGGAMKRMAMVLFGVLLLIGLLSVFVAARNAMLPSEHFGFTLDPAMTMPLALFGLLAAAGVWQREEPSRRAYHLAMPVPRAEHTWLRVGAGWVWLMAGTAAYLVLLVLLGRVVAVIDGGEFVSRFSPWNWIAPFAAATSTYLLCSIAMVGAEQPLVFIVGAPFGLWLVLSLPGLYQWQAGARWVRRLLDSPYSPGSAVWPVFYDAGATITKAHALGSAVPLSLIVDLQKSLTAVAFWWAVGLAGVWWAARRRVR